MKPQELPATPPKKTETITREAVTKTLPSGAVVISTKSPAKQDQPVTTASNDLTGVSIDFIYLFVCFLIVVFLFIYRMMMWTAPNVWVFIAQLVGALQR